MTGLLLALKVIFGLALVVAEAFLGETKALVGSLSWSDVGWVLVHTIGVFVFVAGAAQWLFAADAYLIGLLAGALSGLLNLAQKYFSGPSKPAPAKKTFYD